MSSSSKAAMAFAAMKALGISEKKVKPVLKNLLKLYDKNWALIEDENYRALADAIFEFDEVKVDESKDTEEPVDSVPPLRRLRLRNNEEQSSLEGEPSHKRPKPEGDNLLQSSPLEENVEPLQVCLGGLISEHEPVSPQNHLSRINKELSSPTESSRPESADATQLHLRDTRNEPQNLSLQTRQRDKGKEPLVLPEDGHRREREEQSQPGIKIREDEPTSPQLVPRKRRLVNGRSRSGVCLIQPKLEPDIDVFPQDTLVRCDQNNTSNIGNIAPSTCDLPQLEIPIVAVHPSNEASTRDEGLLHKDSINGNDPKDKLVGHEQAFQHATARDGISSSSKPCDTLKGNELANIPEESTSEVEIASVPSGEVLVPLVPRPLARNDFDDLFGTEQPNQEALGNFNSETDKINVQNHPDPSSLDNLAVVPHQDTTPDDIRPLHDVNDITRGEEKVQISVVNEVNSEPCPPLFYYIPKNMTYKKAHVSISLARIGDEDCCSNCYGDCLSSSIPCACALVTGGEFAYTFEGLVKEKILDECISLCRSPQQDCLFYCNDCPVERCKNENPSEPCKGHLPRKFIKECWSKCGCNKHCGNRVVQRGTKCNLQVFFTPEGKGWGLRALEPLPRGTFVCEYAGEILTSREMYERNMLRSTTDQDSCSVLLDADWGSQRVLKDEQALWLDAASYGNIARFLNHRCFDANLVEIPIEVETPNRTYYHLAFFTARNINAMEELTWDYGIDFNLPNHPAKAFRCRCGSNCCRDMKRPQKGKHSALVLR